MTAILPCSLILLLAFPALTGKLKQMAVDFEARLAGKLFLQRLKVATGKVQHRAAIRADEVVMVTWRPAQKIAPGVAFGMDFTNESEAGKHFKCAVNCYKRDAGVSTARLFEYFSRGEVRVAPGDYLDEMTACRGELVPLLSQDVGYPLFCEHYRIPN